MGRGLTQASKEISYITPDEIIIIHDEVMKRFGGGESGILCGGEGKLDILVDRMKYRIFDHQPFDDIIKKTAFMFQSILIYHPFVDGMKRTGIYSSFAFLLKNKYLFISRGVDDSVDFAVSVAGDTINEKPEKSLAIIGDWFSDRIISLSDIDSVLAYAKKSRKKFKCPRCASEHVTVEQPFCYDCGLQLIDFTLHLDGIVHTESITFKRQESLHPAFFKRGQHSTIRR